MPTWKKNIFVNAIKTRMVVEGKAAEVIIVDYVALIEAERTEILTAITTQ